MHIRERSHGNRITALDLLLEGEVVSGVWIREREMRIGCARVSMGGIGGVHTDKEHRKRGHSRRVMDRSIEFMAERGCDVSLLFGIREFYPRWGYATMIADQRMTLATTAAAMARSALRTRAFRKADMPRLLRIYAATNELRTGAIIRPPFPRNGFPMGTRFFTNVSLFVAIDARAQIVGYVGFDKEFVDRDTGEVTPIADDLSVCEIAATDPRAYDALLQRLAREAKQRGIEEIRFCLPADHEFARHARSYGAVVRVETRADGGPMMRIINLRSLMGKLEPELARRVDGRGMDMSLGFATDLGDVTLRLGRRGARVVEGLRSPDKTFELQQWKLLQLILGYRSLEQVMADPRSAAFAPHGGVATRRPSLSAEVRAAGEALFPSQFAFCWHPDWF